MSAVLESPYRAGIQKVAKAAQECEAAEVLAYLLRKTEGRDPCGVIPEIVRGIERGEHRGDYEPFPQT